MADNLQFQPEFFSKTWQNESKFHLEEWAYKIKKFLERRKLSGDLY